MRAKPMIRGAKASTKMGTTPNDRTSSITFETKELSQASTAELTTYIDPAREAEARITGAPIKYWVNTWLGRDGYFICQYRDGI